MKTKTLRKIAQIKKIINMFEVLFFSLFYLFVFIMIAIGLFSLIPPLKTSLLLKILIMTPILLLMVILRSKFSINLNIKRPLNWVYCFLYFFIFIGLVDYIPRIINLEGTITYIITGTSLFIFLFFGDLFLKKVKRIYLQYKILVEKGKQYDLAKPILEDLAKKIKH